LATIQDPFLKKALMLAIDGAEPEELRSMMELELDNQEEHGEKISQVFEAAGGYAPTVGIIGAVLGLIQVMQHLEDITEVGKGIAVAFVATIYGVGLANILFLPWAGKLKIKFRGEQILREMKLEGVISILEGMNPRMLETKLMGYLPEHKQQPAEKAAGASA
jgi:chemotaxis protein MotA